MNSQSETANRLFDRNVWLMLLLSLCGIAVYTLFKYEAFPVASLEIKKPRLEIQAQAKTIASKMGFAKSQLIESTIFTYDYLPKTFLEHEYWLGKADQLMSHEVPIWYWKTRFCKEFDQEEFSTWISPQGTLIAFTRTVSNDIQMTSVSHERARALGEDFLKQTNPDWQKYSTLVADATYTRGKRQDHSFTWEDQKTDFQGAHLRLYVYLSGDQVTSCSKFLHVPESWSRDFYTKRTYNDLLGNIAFSFLNLFKTAAYLIAIWGIVTGTIRWRIAIAGGILLGGFSALDYFNDWPRLVANYNPSVSFNDYLGSLLIPALQLFSSGILSGMSLFAGAEIAYRRMFPEKIAMETLLTRSGLTHFSVSQGVLVGHLLVGISLGWVVLYYIAGKHLNYWCPLAVENHQVLSHIVPFVSAVAIGISASFEEELACRVVGLAICTKLFKNFWIANLLQAAIWGFAHSFYAQEPAYARGIELTIVGVAQGWILRTYGIVPCVAAHYLLDAFFEVEPFLYSNLSELKWSVLPALVPFLVIIGLAQVRWLKETTPKNEVLKNADLPLGRMESHLFEEPVETFEAKPLSKPVRLALVVTLALCIFSFVLLPHPQCIDDDVRLKIDRNGALTKASLIMEKHEIKPNGWHRCAVVTDNSTDFAFQYLFEKSNLATVKRMFDLGRRGFDWKVRFFKPDQNEEYCVYLDGQGNEKAFQIVRAENEQGVTISSDQARILADRYLKEIHPELINFAYRQTSTQKRKFITDYTVEYNCPELKVGEAQCHVSIGIVGDQVGSFYEWWEVPDSWVFEQSKRNTTKIALSQLWTVTRMAGFLLFLWWCYSLLKTNAVKFRIPLVLTCAWAVLLTVNEINEFPGFFNFYTTTTPIKSFIAERLLFTSGQVLGCCVGTFLLAVITLGALRILESRVPIKSFLTYAFGKTDPLRPAQIKNKFDLWFDATIIAFASIAFCRLVVQVYQIVWSAVSPLLPYAAQNSLLFSLAGSIPWTSRGAICDLANVGSPLLYVATNAVQNTFQIGAMLIVTIGMMAKFAPGFCRSFFLVLPIIAIYYNGDKYWQNYVLDFMYGVLLFLFCYFMVAKVARNNYLAYALFFTMGTLVFFLEAFMQNGASVFQAEMTVVSIAILSPLMFTVRLYFKRHNS